MSVYTCFLDPANAYDRVSHKHSLSVLNGQTLVV